MIQEKKYRVAYPHSKVWLIVWAILCFPIAIYLVIFRGQLKMDNQSFSFNYPGSLFWPAAFMILGFVISKFFFAIVILLFLVNGIHVKQSKQLASSVEPAKA